MFDHIFENRDKKLINLIKLGDYLGRSLRENVELFKVSDYESSVQYVTEGGMVVRATYSEEDQLTLSDIQVEAVDVYLDDDKFEDHIEKKVSNFIHSLYENDFGETETNFKEILDGWNDRIRFDQTNKRLHEKINKFSDQTNIVTTPEFTRFLEIAPQLLSFLKENEEKISNIPEIKNAVKLSNVVAHAFNLPRLNYHTLIKEEVYSIPADKNSSIYEMICKQELIKKDLLESKKQFDNAWATNDKVRQLAGLIYESDEAIGEGLSEVITEIPYFAFVSKKQITESVKNALNMVEDQVSITDKELQTFVSTIFEMKKNIKTELTSILSEKYGVNIQTLKESPTFKSLINTQVLIFELLSRLSPRKSLQRDTLREMSIMLKEKSGVQGIDVNDCLNILFEKAGYSEFLEEDSLLNQLNLGDAVENVEAEMEIGVPDVEDTIEIDNTEELTEKKKKGHKGKSCDEEHPKTSHEEWEDAQDRTAAEEEEAEEEGEPGPDMDEETDSKKGKKKSPLEKSQFLDALGELEEILNTIDSSKKSSDIDEDDDEDGDDKKKRQKYGGNKGDIPDKDRKKKGHYGRGPKTKETAEEEGEEDYKDTKKDNGKSDKTYRKDVMKDAQTKAAKKEKKRKGPKELGDSDDEV